MHAPGWRGSHLLGGDFFVADAIPERRPGGFQRTGGQVPAERPPCQAGGGGGELLGVHVRRLRHKPLHELEWEHATSTHLKAAHRCCKPMQFQLPTEGQQMCKLMMLTGEIVTITTGHADSSNAKQILECVHVLYVHSFIGIMHSAWMISSCLA